MKVKGQGQGQKVISAHILERFFKVFQSLSKFMHLFIFDQICFKFGAHHYWMMTFIPMIHFFFF